MDQNKAQYSTTLLSSWMRVQLYEKDYRRDAVYRVGTVYGRDLSILSSQVGALVQRKWLTSGASELTIHRSNFEMSLPLSPMRELFLAFEIPGNENPRSKAQTFSVLCRGIKEVLKTRPERRQKTE